MRRVDLELLVQNAVQSMRAGRKVEDDRIEVKSDWPMVSKARQLAGAANGLRGETLIYIIGCNESGVCAPQSDLDPETWYSQISAAFDSSAPRLLLHANVVISDDPSDSVVALAFATDEIPYVRTVNGSPDRREVPLRVATGTVSANRSQLLRVLAPVVQRPRCEIVDLDLEIDYSTYEEIPANDSLQWKGRPARSELSWSIRGRVFIEFLGPGSATISNRSLRARAAAPGLQEIELPVRVNERQGFRDRPEPAPPRYGVDAHHGFIVTNAPGDFTFSSFARSVSETDDPEFDTLVDAWLDAAMIDFQMKFDFIGSERSIFLEARVENLETRDSNAGPWEWRKSGELAERQEIWS